MSKDTQLTQRTWTQKTDPDAFFCHISHLAGPFQKPFLLSACEQHPLPFPPALLRLPSEPTCVTTGPILGTSQASVLCAALTIPVLQVGKLRQGAGRPAPGWEVGDPGHAQCVWSRKPRSPAGPRAQSYRGRPPAINTWVPQGLTARSVLVLTLFYSFIYFNLYLFASAHGGGIQTLGCGVQNLVP